MTGDRQPPAVSIIMPVHTVAETYFREAIDSVRNQSYPHWELLISLDSASAECAHIAREAAATDPQRIRVVGQEGGRPAGHSVARNLALTQASAPLIAFLDADDVLLPNHFAEQIPILGRHPAAAMLYGRTVYWHSWTGNLSDRHRDYTPRLGVQPGVVQPPTGLLCRFLDGSSMVPCTCSVLVHRYAIDTVGGFEDQFNVIYGDQAFYAKIALQFPILPWDAVWDRYRRHPRSVTMLSTRSVEIYHRRQFLDWVRERAERLGISDARLNSTIEGELWKLRHPRIARLLRIVRRFRRRVAMAMKPR